MSIYSIHHVDSFTNTVFGGNPTVTVLDAKTLTDDQMRKIAREMNLSETGFVLPSTKADFRLRYFTPAGDEIKFCGHATVGALATIAKEKLFGCVPPGKKFLIETNAGIMAMEVDLSRPDNPVYKMGLPKIDLVQTKLTYQELAEGLGIPEDLMDHSKPIMVERTNNYLYFAATTLDSLGKLVPDTRLAKEFCRKDGTVVICAMTAGAFDKRNHIHARGFAPLVGVPEDPFTGSMQGGLAAYALRNGMVDPNATWIGSEQGHFINRPGDVGIEIVSRDPTQVILHAEAAHVFSAKMFLK